MELHTIQDKTACKVFFETAHDDLQIQEELDRLATQATANAMDAISSERHVFTSDVAYMNLFNKMKGRIASANEHLDEVSNYFFLSQL